MADELDAPLARRLLAVIEAGHLSGSPVVGSGATDQQQMARAAIKRWRSYSRRYFHPEQATHTGRVEDLAKGLRDRFESEPTLTGPLMTDYRHLAIQLAAVLAGLPTD